MRVLFFVEEFYDTHQFSLLSLKMWLRCRRSREGVTWGLKVVDNPNRHSTRFLEYREIQDEEQIVEKILTELRKQEPNFAPNVDSLDNLVGMYLKRYLTIHTQRLMSNNDSLGDPDHRVWVDSCYFPNGRYLLLLGMEIAYVPSPKTNIHVQEKFVEIMTRFDAPCTLPGKVVSYLAHFCPDILDMRDPSLLDLEFPASAWSRCNPFKGFNIGAFL